MHLKWYCLIALFALSTSVSAAVKKPHAPLHAVKSKAASGIDKRFTLAQRKRMFTERMSIAYRAMYDAKGNEILGDQLTDKYRQQFNKRYKMSEADGHALELEGAAHEWPAQAGKTP